MRRVGLPPGGSTLMTSAPSPASVSPQYSACSSASSTTRMPARGPGLAVPVFEAERSSCAAILLLLQVQRRARGRLGAVDADSRTLPRNAVHLRVPRE